MRFAFSTCASILTYLLLRRFRGFTLSFKVFSIHLNLLSVKSNNRKPKFGKLNPEELLQGCKLGTDSHAEVTCYGKHAKITAIHEGKSVSVSPFHDSYSPLNNVNFANATFAYDAPDGQVYLLHHHYGLDFTNSMTDSILCTNQTRAAGIVVDDVPTCFDKRGDSTHSIFFPTENVRLPLSLHNAVSYLPVRYPTDDDINHGIDLQLSDDIPWDPTLFGDNASVSVSKVNYDFSECVDIVDQSLDEQNLADIMAQPLNVSAVSHEIRPDMDAEKLAEMWHISIENAARTLRCTTMDRIRKLRGNIHKRFKTKVHQKRYKQLGGYLAMFASDTFLSNVTSLRGNKYIQLFCNRGNYNVCYPLKKKEHAHHALDRFLHEVGVPREILTDGAKELIMAEWGKTCRKHGIYQVNTEPHSPWQNIAEKNGGLIKRKVKHLMQTTNTPVVLWDYCWEYAAAIRSHVAVDNILLDDVTPYEKVHGYSPNITEYTVFKWYDWIEYDDPTSPDASRIGRWLGPAHNVGQGYAHYVLSSDAKVVTRSTVKRLKPEELASPAIRERMDIYSKNVNELIGNFAQSTLNKTDDKSDSPYENLFGGDHLDDELIEPAEVDDLGNPVSTPDVDLPVDDQAFMANDDMMVGIKVPIERGGEVLEGTVISRKRRPDGSLVGTANPNRTLDTRIYEVEFPDGTYSEYATNVLLENLYSHIDDDGYHNMTMKGIVDHQVLENAVPIERGFYEDSHGIKRRVITTKGWNIKVEWSDGTTSWVPLSLVKESNPLETAQYAKSRNIIEQPAFAWWALHVLKKVKAIIKATTYRKVRKKLKFGVVVPDTYEEALQLDKENGNDFWQKSIAKEIKNVKIAFKMLNEGEKPPPGSKKIPYHLIFDVKFDLTRKSRLVAGGHRNKEVPAHATYSSVASRDSVRLAFLLASLNDLNILSADIGNAFLNAPPRERVHVTLGPDIFGREYEGRTAVIVRALYGLKSASAAWRHHFSSFIRNELKYVPTLADPDVYRKPMCKPDGFEYYSYLVLYVDDVLCLDYDPKQTMNKIETMFRLKDGVEKPNMYLGTDTREWTVQDENGSTITCWGVGSSSYVKEAVRTAEVNFNKHNLTYSSSKRQGRNTPFKNPDYRPELDASDICDDEKITLFQNLIGMLRWTCELGRIDILHETSILSQYLAQPRIGHLQEAINIFYYLKHHDRSWMVMDPRRFDVEWIPRKDGESHPCDRAQAMKELYPDSEDQLPYNMPQPRGNPVDISVFVDADHAGNRVTRRSHTGIIIYVNQAPIMWYSKKQNTIETSTFGSEFVALKIAVKLVESLIYKLRMFGVPIEGEARIFCDNESVVNSSGNPETVLKKKHCSVAYHKVREMVASGKVLIYYEHSSSNLADLLTKPLSSSKRQPLIQALLH